MMKKFFLCFLLAQTSFVSAQNVLYPIIQNSKFGLADANGNIQVQATFDEIDFLRAGFLAVAKNGKWGVIDFKGTEIIPLKYDRVRKLEGSMGTLALARIEQNELEGIIDLGTQKEVLPCKYEAISAVVNGLLVTGIIAIFIAFFTHIKEWWVITFLLWGVFFLIVYCFIYIILYPPNPHKTRFGRNKKAVLINKIMGSPT